MKLKEKISLYRHLFMTSKASKALGFLNKKVEGLLVSLDGDPFLVAPDDMVVGREVRRHGDYQRWELDLILSAVTGDSAVLFVGAHVGTHVVRVAPHVRSVTAIEANPDSFRLLEMNCRLRGLTNVKARNFAAMDKMGEVKFLHNRANSGGAKILPKKMRYLYTHDRPKLISVHGDRLDSHLAGSGYDVIFMDIEGAEYYALKGMQDLLGKASHLFVEFVPHHLRFVSGVSVAQFLSQIAPHFTEFYLPGRDQRLAIADAEPVLRQMFDDDASENIIVFSKTP